MPPPSGPSRGSLHPSADYQLGLVAYENKRWADAIAILDRIADRSDLPGTLARYYLSSAQLQLGLDELRAARFKQAELLLRAAAARGDRTADLAGHLAAAFVGQGRFDLAADQYERQIAAGAGAEADIRLALASWKQGNRERAVEHLLRAARREPENADICFQLGLLYAAGDDYAAAIEALRTAIRLAPRYTEAHAHLGLTFAAIGNPALALRHLRIAQQLRPADPYLALQLTFATKAAAEAGAADVPTAASPGAAPPDPQAMRQLSAVIIDDPEFVEAFLALPQSGLDRDLFALLAATLEHALERHPEFADLHFHCSRVYQRLGRRDDAIAAANRAVRANPRYVQALIHLGRLYGETDRTQDAIDRLAEAIERGGDYPDVHVLLGRLYRQRGDRPRAKREFERALELNSGYTEAAAALAELVA